MLTDAGYRWRIGVIGVAHDTVNAGGPTVGKVVVVATLVFALGAFAGFIVRLLWPRPHA